MTEEQLRALIRRGEDQRTEFKAAEADAADVARAITALANSGGGTLLIGVSDDGGLTGLWYAQPAHIARNVRTMPDLSRWRQFVVNVSRHNCEPAAPIGMEHVAIEGRDVLVVHVPDGSCPPSRGCYCSARDRRTACRPRRSSAPSSTASTRAASSATGPTWSGRSTE